jgi:hypothetical protein
MNMAIRFSMAGKEWLTQRIMNGKDGMLPALLSSSGVEWHDSESGICLFKYHGKHYTIGWYLSDDIDKPSIRIIFGHKVSIADSIIDELNNKYLDLLSVVDLNTGDNKELLHAVDVF